LGKKTENLFQTLKMGKKGKLWPPKQIGVEPGIFKP